MPPRAPLPDTARIGRPRRASGLRVPRLTYVLLAGAAGSAGGCSTYRAPTVEVVEAAATEETDSGLVLTFTLSARNENDVELPLRDARYTLSLDGREVFSGVRAAEATLRRSGAQLITLPAAVALGPDEPPRPTGVVPYRLSGELTYIVPGALAETLFDTGVRRPDVGLNLQGLIDLGSGPGEPARLVDTAEQDGAGPG